MGQTPGKMGMTFLELGTLPPLIRNRPIAIAGLFLRNHIIKTWNCT